MITSVFTDFTERTTPMLNEFIDKVTLPEEETEAA